MSTPRSNYGRIVHEGMGGFLNPPTHPEHDWSVHSSYGQTFCMSLSAAAKSEWLNPATRGAAKGKLKAWKPLPIDNPDVQDWICQVLGYFRGCYQGDNGSWDASGLNIDSSKDPILFQDTHAGVHHIREYYPDFKLTKEIADKAYWGRKA